jgi:hypothetical protein
MLNLSLVYLLEHLCSSLAWFIFWSIYAQPLFGLSSGASMLILSLVYLLEHLCSTLSGVRIALSLVFCVVFYRSLFCLFVVFCHCRLFLITPLVSSNFS